MQLMTWALGRLGSRFSLLFEPHHRRVTHSGLGRFLDEPMDLMVGLVEPDGTQRVLPFTQQGKLLYNCEQFDRVNSTTFRSFSERYRLRFELNVHSVFYPQDEAVCLMPAIYLEMRLNPAEKVRWVEPADDRPERLKLFLRIARPNTTIEARGGEPAAIDLAYRNSLTPRFQAEGVAFSDGDSSPGDVQVVERIQSINAGAQPTEQGDGLEIELPVTDVGSGVKWRMVWASYCSEPVMRRTDGGDAGDDDDAGERPMRFRYTEYWSGLDEVVEHAAKHRDDYLALSRRFEKLLDQLPIDWSKRHLINQSFQAFLTNTWWLNDEQGGQWFTTWEGCCLYHNTLDVEYNISLLYLTLWPKLLAMQLAQWPQFERKHEPSGGGFLSHDIGYGTAVCGPRFQHEMPVEENCDYLLMMQAFAHWTGNLEMPRGYADLIGRLAKYLIWTDREGSGFATEGTANTIDDASPAVQYAKKQTYLAVKRLAALRAAADLLYRVGDDEEARRCEGVVERDASKIEQDAWLADHYVVCTDKSTAGIVDAWTGEPLPFDEMPGWDAYSIYTGNGLLLPVLVGQPLILDPDRLRADLSNATRETLSPYGCGHSSYENENVWISQNLWRDHLAQYLGVHRPSLASRYWDMQVMSNTGAQSHGYIDTYIGNNLSFYPRGAVSFGYVVALPRLIIDRLSPGGERISVNPDRSSPARWPLLPLADWRAHRIPVCVVDEQGDVTIEGEMEGIIIHGDEPEELDVIG